VQPDPLSTQVQDGTPAAVLSDKPTPATFAINLAPDFNNAPASSALPQANIATGIGTSPVVSPNTVDGLARRIHEGFH
jgi:hypothetical protein